MASARHGGSRALRRGAVGACVLALAAGACTTIDPGPDFVVPDQTFDADYFFCHVEPQFLFSEGCGPGDSSKGDPTNGCHYNSSAVSGMALLQHAPVDCGGGDHPIDQTTVGSGSPPQSNLQAASLEMSRDYINAPIIVRPTGNSHPRAVFNVDDPVVQIIATWATK